MCGRYTLLEEVEDLSVEFDLREAAVLSPRYNIAPTQDVPVVRLHDARTPQGLMFLLTVEAHIVCRDSGRLVLTIEITFARDHLLRVTAIEQ